MTPSAHARAYKYKKAYIRRTLIDGRTLPPRRGFPPLNPPFPRTPHIIRIPRRGKPLSCAHISALASLAAMRLLLSSSEIGGDESRSTVPDLSAEKVHPLRGFP